MGQAAAGLCDTPIRTCQTRAPRRDGNDRNGFEMGLKWLFFAAWFCVKKSVGGKVAERKWLLGKELGVSWRVGCLLSGRAFVVFLILGETRTHGVLSHGRTCCAGGGQSLRNRTRGVNRGMFWLSERRRLGRKSCQLSAISGQQDGWAGGGGGWTMESRAQAEVTCATRPLRSE
jgi:hypothetical protein